MEKAKHNIDAFEKFANEIKLERKKSGKRLKRLTRAQKDAIGLDNKSSLRYDGIHVPERDELFDEGGSQ